MIETIEQARICVAAGSAWLDANYGADWRTEIHWDTLDQGHSHYCVLGQLYGDWELSPLCGTGEADELGFLVISDVFPVGTEITNMEAWDTERRRILRAYALLTQAWLEIKPV